MKKLIITTTAIFIAIAFTAFTTNSVKPKFFPELEKFYTSISSASVDSTHKIALRDMTSYITQGITSDNKINLLFTCPDNSFKSQAAQIVLQSLLSVNKYSKLAPVSCGYQNSDINPTLIKVLNKHGFQVSESTAPIGGKKTYEVKFGENMSSLFIYSKQSADASIPKSAFFLTKMCSSDENTCIDLSGASFTESLSFPLVNNSISDDEADKEFTTIATEIMYAFNKAKP